MTEDSHEIFFYDLSRNLRTYKSRNNFDSKAEAEEWVRKYECEGEIVTVLENNRCTAYLVDGYGRLRSFSSDSGSGVSVQADYLIEDPDDPAYIWNKPTSFPISFIDGLAEVLSTKTQITNKAAPGVLMVADNTGNLRGSDVTLESLMSSLQDKVEITEPVSADTLLVSDGRGGLKSSDIKPQEIFSTLSKKVEVVGEVSPGSLLVATEEGNLQCCGVPYSNILLKEDIISGSKSSTVTLDSTGVFIIQIPEDMLEYSSLQVYHNGMLLVENTHYTVSDKFITLIGHATYSGDLFTFVGYGSTGKLPDIEDCHKHENKEVLDSITQDMVDLWNSRADVSYVSKEELFDNDGLILQELLPKYEEGLKLGDTAETAFRGDLGSIAYEHSQEDHAPATAQENKIEAVAIGGKLLPIANKLVTIPIGDEEKLGVVKSSTELNKVFIEEDGTMSVAGVDATKLSVPEGEELILVSGDSNN